MEPPVLFSTASFPPIWHPDPANLQPAVSGASRFLRTRSPATPVYPSCRPTHTSNPSPHPTAKLALIAGYN